MRAILPRILLALVLAVGCLSVGYIIGNKHGHAVVDREWDQMDIHDYLLIRKFLKDGDTNRIEKLTHDLIVAHILYYDTHFSSEIVTDPPLVNDLIVARAMEAKNRAEWVEYNKTNRWPNTALEPTATAPTVSTNK